uniref:Tripartite motif-containing protein 16-like n=1 Tax=Erpetoichthys calabaricus TaxID=27687 RepID=A0A8C4TNB4_ERPCA
MAAAQPSLSTDHYTCPVCLEVLNVPVTIPCAHHYCMECINKQWDQSGLMGTYRCPQCRMEFHPRPQLYENTNLSNKIKELKEVIRAPPRGNEPTGNLEEKLCPKHQRVLEMFCRTDEICICSVCAATEHKSHHTKILDEEITERKVRSVIKQLEKEIKELRKTESELAKLSKTDDHMQLLKVTQSEKKLVFRLIVFIQKLGLRCLCGWSPYQPRFMCLLYQMAHVGFLDIKFFAFVDLLPSAQVSGSTMAADFFTCFLVFSLHSDTCSLTLDLNTAHKRLHLSKDKKKVTCEEKEIRYHAHDDRFNTWQQILCREAQFRTRHYWEVEWSGDKADIGVTYRGIGRKGEGNECVLGLNDKSWSLSCSEAGVSASHNNQKTDISVPISHRIGVYLDRPGGSLSFYSISDTMTLLHKFNASFTEPLFAGFRVRPNSSVTICPLNGSVQRLASSAGPSTSSVSQVTF